MRRISGNAQFAVSGSISVSPFDSPEEIGVEGGLISLNKSNSVTKDLGDISGLKEGKLTITSGWNHAIGPVPGPLPVKLKFALINPSGTVVASQSAYSSDNLISSPKLKLVFRVPTCTPGQWKLRITNNSNDDTMNINPKAEFVSSCQN